MSITEIFYYKKSLGIVWLENVSGVTCDPFYDYNYSQNHRR